MGQGSRMASIHKPTSKRDFTDDAAGGIAKALGILRKNWSLVAALAVIGFGASFFYSKTLPRIFQSQSMLELDPHINHPLGEKGEGVITLGSGDFWDSQEYYNTQYKILTSDRIMTTAARKADLPSDW